MGLSVVGFLSKFPLTTIFSSFPAILNFCHLVMFETRILKILFHVHRGPTLDPLLIGQSCAVMLLLLLLAHCDEVEDQFPPTLGILWIMHCCSRGGSDYTPLLTFLLQLGMLHPFWIPGGYVGDLYRLLPSGPRLHLKKWCQNGSTGRVRTSQIFHPTTSCVLLASSSSFCSSPLPSFSIPSLLKMPFQED